MTRLISALVLCTLASVALAQDRAAEFGHDLQTEVLLYCLHGLLHLAGFDDMKPKLAREMEAAQTELLRSVLRKR